MAGDLRWSGTFGVNVDFVARSHCSVALITIEDIQVVSCEKEEILFMFHPIYFTYNQIFGVLNEA